jgi:kynureninase
MADVRARSIALAEQFVREVEAACPTLALASPRDPEARGSQISFRHPEGYAIMQALIARGVIGDYRAPDILRFGITPLYTSAADVSAAARALGEVMAGALWDRPEYKKRARVT